jgi:hypothetical protein
MEADIVIQEGVLLCREVIDVGALVEKVIRDIFDSLRELLFLTLGQ